MAKFHLVEGETIILRCNRGNFRTIVFSTIFVPIHYYWYLANRYTITNKRIKVQNGIFFTSERDVALAKIESIDTKRDFFNRLSRILTLGLCPEQGDIVVHTVNGVMVLKGVPNPERVRQTVSNLLIE